MLRKASLKQLVGIALPPTQIQTHRLSRSGGGCSWRGAQTADARLRPVSRNLGRFGRTPGRAVAEGSLVIEPTCNKVLVANKNCVSLIHNSTAVPPPPWDEECPYLMKLDSGQGGDNMKTRSSRRAKSLYAIGFVAVQLSSAAFSQTSQKQNQNQSDDIVVTAQKRSENLQDTPAAVTAATGDRLLQLGVQNINQLAIVAPSVKIVPIRNQTMIYLRGVGQALTQPNADPSIAVNINGAYVPSDLTGNAFFDVERVEVLPGPQGTLYGRNAAGGVINVITRLPSSEFSGEGYIEAGNYERIQGFAAFSAPISNTLGVRAAVSLTDHDGYFDNGADDQDSSAARLTIAWTPSAQTKAVAIAMYAHDGGIGQQQQTKPTPRPRHLAFDPRAAGLFIDFDTYITSFQLDHQFSDEITFTYIAGYDHMKADANTEIFIGPPLAIVKNRNMTESHTQEARLSGTLESIDILAGVYYYWTKALYDAPFDTGRLFFRTDFDARSEGQAAFGRVTWHASERLRLTGGLRYSHDEKKIEGVNTTIVGPSTTIVPYKGRRSDDRVDWKAEVELDVTDDSMLYANAATGYNTGGLSNSSVRLGSTEAAPFESIKLLAFTAGSKNRLLGGALTLNVEAFYYDYKDYQVSARNPASFQNQLFNAKKSEIYGVQVDARVRPTDDDDFNANVSYLHAEATNLVTPAGNFSGFELPYSPKWTASLSHQHVFNLASGDTIETFASAQYVGDRWGQYTHLPGTFLDEYFQVDATLTYRPSSKKWSISAWVRNLTDEDVYATLLAGGPPGPASGNFHPPRTYGLRLGAQF